MGRMVTKIAGPLHLASRAGRIVLAVPLTRQLPANRNVLLAAGLPQVVDYLLNLSFTGEEIDYLRGLAQFRLAPPEFFEYLRTFRFTGDLFAVPEGTPSFAAIAGSECSAAA